jgi:hypothetical protein
LQGSKQLLILDQALHHSLNGSIGFVVMIDLHEDYKVLEDHVDNHKMVGDVQAAKAPQSMCLRRTDLWIKNYALDLLGCLSLESCIFLGQFRELLFEVAGSEGEVFYILDQRSFDYRLSRIASGYSASLKRLQRPSRKSSIPSVTLVMKSSSSCDFFNGITAFFLAIRACHANAF